MICDILKKKLLYRSANRGWKETDILLGEFTKNNIDLMTEEQLDMLDLILDQPDGDIFNWITMKVEVPTEYNNEVLMMLKEFKL